MPCFLGDATQCRVTNRSRLLVDFFEHEVLKATLFRKNRIPCNTLHFPRHRFAVEVGQLHTVRGYDGHVTIAEKKDVASVMKDRRNIGRDEVFVVTESDHRWRSVTRGNDFVGLSG